MLFIDIMSSERDDELGFSSFTTVGAAALRITRRLKLDQKISSDEHNPDDHLASEADQNAAYETVGFGHVSPDADYDFSEEDAGKNSGAAEHGVEREFVRPILGVLVTHGQCPLIETIIMSVSAAITSPPTPTAADSSGSPAIANAIETMPKISAQAAALIVINTPAAVSSIVALHMFCVEKQFALPPAANDRAAKRKAMS